MANHIERDHQTSRVVIRPSRGIGIRFHELWEYRELLYFLIWRDVKVRYKQTVFGSAWAVLQPLLLMIVFALFLGKLAKVPSDGLPYPLFVFTALVPWTLFAQSLTVSSLSLVENRNLVSKVYFPRLFLPVAATGSFLIDFVIAFGLLVGMMIYYGHVPDTAVVWIPAFAVLAVLTALGVGIFLSAINARYRDVQHAVPLLVQVWLFLSPVAYPSSLVPEAYRTLYGLNPMAGVVEGFRWSLLGTTTRPTGIVIASTIVTVLLLLIGLIYFRRTERTLADVI